MSVPTIEPKSLVAGDTWQWDREAPDHLPADGWALTYVFVNADHRFSVTSAPSGSLHRITIAAADSDEKIPGIYDWAAFAKKAAERYQVATGRLKITPNLEGDRPFDLRTDARKRLDALVAVELQSLTDSRWMTKSYTIRDRSYTFRDSKDLRDAIKDARDEVRREELAAAHAAGTFNRRIGVRLQRV